MATRIIEIPLNEGQDESVDRVLLPDGKFRVLQNCRLSRDGRIEPRPLYTAIPLTLIDGGTLVPFDLAAYQDALICMGSTSVNDSAPSNLFTRINQAQGEWKTCTSAATSVPRYSIASDIEVVWSAKYGLTWSNCDVAYANGNVCVVYTDANGSAVGGQTAYVEIFRSDTGELVLQTTVGSVLGARVAGCGNSFILVTLTTGNALTAREFTTGVDTAFGSPTTLSSNIAASLAWDLENLGGTSDYLVAYSNSSTGNLHVRRYNNAHSQQWEHTISSLQGHIACGGNTGENVTIAWVSTAATTTVSAKTVTAAGGIQVVGTTAIFSTTALNTQPRVRRQDATRHQISAVAPGSGSAPVDFDLLSATITTASIGVPSVTRQLNVKMNSKSFSYPDTNLRRCAAMGTSTQAGTSSFPLLASTIVGTDLLNTFAKFNHGTAGIFAEGASSTPRVGAASVATDGAGTYWGLIDVLDETGLQNVLLSSGTLQLVRFKMRSTERRDWAEMQGALYIAGGAVLHYDGRDVIESGYLDAPLITNVAQNTSGSLTQLATYFWVAVYEWYDRLGRVHRSAPSSPIEVTLTGSNDGVVVTVGTPKSARRNVAASTVRTVLYRTTPNDSTLFRVNDGQSGLALTNYAGTIDITDNLSDVDAETKPVLYTQSQTPDSHFAPQPAKYLAAGRDRIILGGLPDPYTVQLSKLPFPGEPIQHGSPNSFKFQARLNERVTAVSAMGDTYLAFTDEGLYEIPGNGPQRNGTGEFNYPRQLYSDGGCINHLSLVHCADGLWFQEAPDKLSLFDGQNVTWAGAPIRDTLAAYPNITGACLLTERQEVVFACNNVSNTDGVLLVYDLRRKVWSVDVIADPITAIVEYDGRLALVRDGEVLLQGTTNQIESYTMRIQTGSFRPFTALGWGDILRVGVLGTFLQDCTVNVQISYDDGANFTTLGQLTVTTSDQAVGSPFVKLYDPREHRCDRFMLRIDVTAVGLAATNALRLHAISLELEAEEFTSRQPDINQL